MTIALISHPDCLLYETEFLEKSDRIRVIEKALLSSSLSSILQSYPGPLATKEQLLLVHDKHYIEKILSFSLSDELIELDPDTYINQYTINAALRAVGSVIYAVDLVMSREVNAAFCNIRPPGHHAERDRGMGFCIFNNVAIAAAYALSHFKLKRIAIIDFDVHHGNGTQDIFQNEKKILFCSIFQYPLYPLSDIETTNNHIINIPLPVGSTGREFRAEIEMKWLEAIDKFKPELIFFSAGFDGHYKDKISGLQLTEYDYAWLTRQIKSIANKHCSGRVISSLEGY